MAEAIRECDIAVIGGGLSGVAAALRACRDGCRVCLTEETPWLGGQVTSQGVSALHEHDYIETFGGTASYYEFREGVRAHYRHRLRLREAAGTAAHFNPGDSWVSRLSFEPAAGLMVLLGMLRPQVDGGRLQILYRARPVEVERVGDEVRSVVVERAGGRTRIRAAFVLDATELGDLLPLAEVPHVTGAESREQTGEPHARSDGPAPHLTQAFAMPFVVDVRPGQDHTVPRPADYERNRDGQPFAVPLTGQPGAFWIHRRILAAERFAPGAIDGDLAQIHGAGNDFTGGDLVGASVAGRRELVARARALSLGFLHWLQTEAPREDSAGRGYPELRLRPDVLGTADGLSMAPHVRESRRILARTTVREHDVSAAFLRDARAVHFDDSVGLGWHPIDIHWLPGDIAATGPTRPFQIPMGALIPRQGPANLLAACKNLGVTHMTNGCYRRHPVEWNTGEAAGALAAFCLGEGASPAAVHEGAGRLRRFQSRLLAAGVPLYWFVDVPLGHPAFAAAQRLAMAGVWPGARGDLRFEPDRALDGPAIEGLDEAVASRVGGRSRAEAAIALDGRLTA